MARLPNQVCLVRPNALRLSCRGVRRSREPGRSKIPRAAATRLRPGLLQARVSPHEEPKELAKNADKMKTGRSRCEAHCRSAFSGRRREKRYFLPETINTSPGKLTPGPFT